VIRGADVGLPRRHRIMPLIGKARAATILGIRFAVPLLRGYK